MRVKLNVRFLLKVVAVAAVLSVGYFFTHRYQTTRRLNDYLVQSARAEAEEKVDRAARLLRSYVLANPKDIDARIHYAELLEKLGQTVHAKRDALSVYEQVLKQAPERHEIRRRAAELSLNLGLVESAENQLKKLRADFPEDGRVLFLIGLCHERQKRFEIAEKEYKLSYEAEPKPDTYVRRAVVLRHLERRDDADAVIDALAGKLPGIYETHLACALYLHMYPDIDAAKLKHLLSQEQHLKKARDFAPDRADVLIASARFAIVQGEKSRHTGANPESTAHFGEEARGYLKHGIDKSPKDEDLYLALADVETFAGRRDKAIEVLSTARKTVAANRIHAVLLALAEQYAEKLAEPDANKNDLVAGVNEVLAALKKSGVDSAKIDFIRGLSLVRQGSWYEASGVLERVRPLFVTQSDKVLRIDLLLAHCYGKLGDIDRQLITYRRAVAATPLDSRPRQGLADSLAALGRCDEAIEEYRHITQMERSESSAWLALAKLMVYQNLTRPEKDRRWGQVSQLLKTVQIATKNAVEVPLLEAEVLFAQGDHKGARLLLTNSRDAQPKESEFWCALATLTDREGDNKAAHAVLDQAIQQVGDRVEFRIARLRITPCTSGKEAFEVLAKVSEGLDRFPTEERIRLLRALAGAYWLIGQSTDAGEAQAIREAGRLWKQVALLRPTELQIRLLLFDVALKLDEEIGMAQALAEINRVEGSGPYGKFVEASRLIWRAVKRGDRSGLAEARNLLATTAARRSTWPRVPLSLAIIDELEQNVEDEIKHLKDAVDLGDRQMVVVKRLVSYLNERDRRIEADEILRRLQAQSPLSNELQRLAAEESLQLLDMTRALFLAQGAVDAKSKDYKERTWLAEILSVSSRWADADQHFEAAIALAGDNPDPLPWTSMIMHTIRQRDSAHDEAALKDINTRLEIALKRAEKILGEKSPLALAMCYELAGKSDLAEAKYLAAIKSDPRDVRAVRATAAFYQKKGSPQKAEPYLRQLLTPELNARLDDVCWARRNLALALALRSESPNYEEAIRLLDLNATITVTAGDIVDDLRTRAIVMATQPGLRQEVIALLEKAKN